MIDIPPEPPMAPEQVIERKLIECGLEPEGFSVRFEDILQSIEIRIEPEANADESMFHCIHTASGTAIVTFANVPTLVAYQDFVVGKYRPQMLADAEKALEELGLLEGFPNPADFETDLEFGAALERLCGLKPGSWIKEFGAGLVIMPDDPNQISFHGENWDQISCLLTAARYSALKFEYFKIGFVGNEAVSDEEN